VTDGTYVADQAMALFPRRRRARAAADAPESAPASEKSARRPPALGEPLRERLRAIAAEAVAPEDAFEPALRVIVEAIGAHAGAVCLFDRREAVLRLAAEVGLTDEGCRQLRTVRRADPASWDMPLNGLLNRRAYLIENASRNRYVPRLVKPETSMRSVACVPLYNGPDPVGSLILVAIAPRTFAERDIGGLDKSIAELTRMIAAARRRGRGQTDAALAPPADVPADELRAVNVRFDDVLPDDAPADDAAADDVPAAELVDETSADRDRLHADLAAGIAERACLAAELAARQGENDRLRASLQASATERARLGAELEAARAAAERVDSLTGSLATAERERARLALALEGVKAGEAERADATSALERARAEAERAAQTAVTALADARRAALSREEALQARAGQLAGELERLRSRVLELERTGEQERDRERARELEYDRLTSELHAAAMREERLRAKLDATLQRATVDGDASLRDALEAARVASEERSVATLGADASRSALSSKEAVIEALEDEAFRAHAEIERLRTIERALRAEHETLAGELADLRVREEEASSRLAELTRLVEGLRDEKERVAVTLHGRESDAASLTARLASSSAERDRLQGALAAARGERDRLALEVEKTTAVQARLEQSLARETAERARLAGVLEATQGALDELQRSQTDRDAVAEERTREIERDVQRLVEECARLTAERDAAVEQKTVPGAPRPREPMRVVTVTGPAPRARSRESEATPLPIAVLDVDRAWEAAADAQPIVVLATGEDVATRLRETPVARVVVNLAAPGALDAVAALRARGSAIRVWGCLADPASDRALPLGMVEPASRPVDPDAVVTALAAHARLGTRVVTAGGDVDALMSLRQALARQGMSVSMAWDGKQARDLFGVVRPEVVVVDLALPRGDGFAIVAQLGTADTPPGLVVLIPGAEDPCAGFAATLADPAYAGRIVTLQGLLAAILARSDESPAERRPKVRAVARK
jgi:predicted  nucleic acid-binding Zn-ribbon protein